MLTTLLCTGPRRTAVATLAALAVPAFAFAQLQVSAVDGSVFGPDGPPFKGARVVLSDGLGKALLTAVTDEKGAFSFRSVAAGVYLAHAEAAPLESASHRLRVEGGLPVHVELRLAPRLTEAVSVTLDEAGLGDTAGTTLAGESVRRMPTTTRTSALRAAIASTPGWTSEDNGLMHFRGVDDGLLFVVDGVPVYERLDPQFGAGFDPSTLGSVRVLSGYVPPEYGLRSGGVVEIRSEAGSIDSWRGFFEGGGGGFGTQGLSGLLQGPLGRETSVTLSGGGERSGRFLDPVHPDNLHNHGHAAGGESEIMWTPGRSVLTLRGGHSRSSYDVPHGASQEAVEQDQRQTLSQTFAMANFQRGFSETTSVQAAIFGRFTRGKLVGGEADAPLFARSDRQQDRLGLLASVSHERGRHRLKAGAEGSRVRLDERFSFFVTDEDAGRDAGFSEAVLKTTLARPFDFAANAARPILSLYAQDSARLSTRLTAEVGIRFDRSRLLVAESLWSPRLGLSCAVGRATFRASMNRLFQPPQTEYLLLGSSPEAQALSPFIGDLGAGGAPVLAERQTAYELGVDLRLPGGLRADAAVWHRRMRNQGDPNLFFGTTIFFPNSVARGRASGLDVRVELPRRAGFSGFATYTLSKIEQFGPINGGLFLEDDIIDIGPGTRFVPDHDQRHAFSAALSYENDRKGFWFAVSGRFRTGTPLEVGDRDVAELIQRPGADLADFDRGRVRPYAVVDVAAERRLARTRGLDLSARASVLNVANKRYAFNFGNPFSGTHFGAPRSARLDLRAALR